MLFLRMMEEAEVLTYAPEFDAEGCPVERLVSARRISAAFTVSSAQRATVADAERPATTCTLTTVRSEAPAFHAVVRRVRDGQMFRVMSEAVTSPVISGIDLAQVTAERWRT